VTIESAVYKIPSPEDKDAPNGPAEFKAQADAIDAIKWLSRSLKPTIGVVQASEGFELPEAYKDVPGTTLELTPAVASTLLVVANWHFQTAAAGTILSGTMSLNGVDQTPTGLLTVGGSNAVYQTVPQVYALALPAEKNTIKMRAKSSTKSVVYSLVAANTRYLYAMFAS
jgi:hypothetical protein